MWQLFQGQRNKRGKGDKRSVRSSHKIAVLDTNPQLQQQVKYLNEVLDLELSLSELRDPSRHMRKLITILYERLSNGGLLMETLEEIEKHLHIVHPPLETPLEDRLSDIADKAYEYHHLIQSQNEPLGDVCELIDDILQAPHAQLRKNLKELHYQLKRISPQYRGSVYREIRPFITST